MYPIAILRAWNDRQQYNVFLVSIGIPPVLLHLKSELSKLLKGLSSLQRLGVHLKNVEPDSLGERPALTHQNLVTRGPAEARGHVGGEILVALLETLVLLLEVQVVPANDNWINNSREWCKLAWQDVTDERETNAPEGFPSSSTVASLQTQLSPMNSNRTPKPHGS